MGGIEDISRKEVFNLPKFQEMGIEKIIENLGGPGKAASAIKQLQEYLYQGIQNG